MTRIRNFLLNFFTILLVIVISVGSARAQDTGDWSAWLYNQATGTFTQVAATGETLQQIDVPHGPTYEWYSYYAAVSPDGQSVAYGEASGEDQNSFNAEIVLYDVNQDRMLATYPLMPGPDALNTSMELFNAATSSIAFDEASDSAAFGYAYRYDPNDPDVYHWQIVALDFMVPPPAPSYTLDSTVAAARLGTQPNALYNVTDLHYMDSTVQFTLRPAFVGQGLSAVSAVWNTETGALDVVENETISGDISDSRGDLGLVMLTLPGRPAEGEIMGVPNYNGIAVADLATGEQQTLFESEAESVLTARFVQNAEAIAVFSTVENATDVQLLILDLEGNVVQSFDDIPFGQLWSTPDGFLYSDQETESLVSVNLRADGARTTLSDDIRGVFSISVVPAEG
jgi:hypothetical protein